MRQFSLLRLLLLVFVSLYSAHAIGQEYRIQPKLAPEFIDASIGFNGVYRLGCWAPLKIEILGGTTPQTGHIVVTVPDTDSVPSTVISPRPVGLEPGKTTTTRMFVRVGQADCQLKAQFVVDGKVLCKRTFYIGNQEDPGYVTGGLPATNRLLLEFGPCFELICLSTAS